MCWTPRFSDNGHTCTSSGYQTIFLLPQDLGMKLQCNATLSPNKPLPILVSPFWRATVLEIRMYRLNCMVSSWQGYPHYPRVRRPHYKACSSDKKGKFSSGQRLANEQAVKQKQQYTGMMSFVLVLASDQEFLVTRWNMESKITLTNVMFPRIPHMYRQGVVVGCFWPGYYEATQANTKTSFLSLAETHLSR